MKNFYWALATLLLLASQAKAADLKGVYTCWANQLQDDQGRRVGIIYDTSNDEKILVDFNANRVELIGRDVAPLPLHSILKTNTSPATASGPWIEGELYPRGSAKIEPAGNFYKLTYLGLLTQGVRVTVGGCYRF